ncbi:flagellar biosynthetic protein FliO [Arthrobacter flavus]|uniref:FliO/MopB family protein n=1 Tax=Arthrobacter flavus TaxID=95172 RepID=A0ABW4Q4S4_9MICC
MDAVVLGLRVLLSLAVVLGLLWYLHRKISRFNRTGNKADPVTIVTRQGISPKASVVMIEADGKRFLLGVTDQSVNVLHTSAAPGLAAVPALSDDDDAHRAGSDRANARPDVGGATFARVLSLATGEAHSAEGRTDGGDPGERRRPARRRAGTDSMTAPTNINQAALTRAGLRDDPARNDPAPDHHKRSGRRAARPATAQAGARPANLNPSKPSPLAGSILSPETWRQTVSALRQGRAG